MKTIEELTGLKRPCLVEYLEEQKRNNEDDALDAYAYNLGMYATKLEQFIEKQEKKKEGYMSLLYGDLKDLEHLNNRAIDLNCDIYLMLEEALVVELCGKHRNIYDTLHEQWYDVLHHQENIINGLQNFINSMNREEKKEDEL